MAGRLPPLNALKVFVAVVETGSFTAAAAQLHVSQSAITRQIALLEQYVGLRLFQRHGRGIVPTTAGATYAQEICPAFDAMAAATANLTRSHQKLPLTIQTYTTLSTKWLIPRLRDYLKEQPGLEVKIVTSSELVDFSKGDIDIAIQYGAGDWGQWASDLILRDEAEPVCSPGFHEQFMGSEDGPQALLATRRLISEQRKDDWDDWSEYAGMQRYLGAETMTFNTYSQVWQATLDGLGISIGYIPQLQQDLEAGRLITPFNKPMRRNRGYYLVRPRSFSTHPHAQSFREWILRVTLDWR